MKTYITFGQAHVHGISGEIFDCNCVAVIEHDADISGRDLAFCIFDDKFCFEYPEQYFKHASMRHFPRGFMFVPVSVIDYYQAEIRAKEK